ncbi:MAG: anti-sigma factor family protein, partial [Caulobacteraceae bacterium]
VLAGVLARRPAPPALRARIAADIRAAARREGGGRRAISPWMRYAATVVATAALTGLATYTLIGRDGGRPLVEGVLNDHVRALATGQTVAIASSDRRIVKPWFDGRVAFSLRVVEMKDAGFLLVGGRVDYLEGQPVAVLVYDRGGRLVDLFLRPVRSGRRPAAGMTRARGLNIVSWSNGTFECWAVSDVATGELLKIKAAMLKGAPGLKDEA